MSSQFIKQVRRDHQRSKDTYRHLINSAKVRDHIVGIFEHQKQNDRDRAEASKLLQTIRRHRKGDPEYEGALKQLNYLHSWPRHLCLELIGGLKWFFWSILREIGALLLLNLRALFIVLANVVVFGAAIALLFTLAQS
ncbi:hypothetical protein [Pelomonas sp. SE-A7]|uniref:hypothetical protein n=1 Tax=Pelomonas sp. SE-A7 TaxID=3054953 RepID=UPI00259CCB47|nr:hypothetical protein [Pelomonas sp. SE-A7]MDM4766160.1 hypothetical protein [Pelomonas sp. SE-A7]